MKLDIEQKTTLWSEGGKFCLDLAKLIFGGIILASIMKKDIDTGKLLVCGALITMFLAVCGFFLILMSKDKKRKENKYGTISIYGIFCFACRWVYPMGIY